MARNEVEKERKRIRMRGGTEVVVRDKPEQNRAEKVKEQFKLKEYGVRNELYRTVQYMVREGLRSSVQNRLEGRGIAEQGRAEQCKEGAVE